MRQDAGERAALVGHADRHPARPCGPQGFDRQCRGTAARRSRPDQAEWLADGGALSGIPFAEGENPPRALDRDGLDRGCAQAFADAARARGPAGSRGRADPCAPMAICCTSSCRRSPTGAPTNMAARLENRMRFPLEVFDAVRAAFPVRSPGHHAGLGDRLGRRRLGHRADDRLCASSRSSAAAPRIHVSSGGSGIQRSRSRWVRATRCRSRALSKQATSACPSIAVGMITEFEQAEAIVGTGDADLDRLGSRTILYDPRWPWHAAAHFGETVSAPDQYLRCQPRQFRSLFESVRQQ